MGGTRSRKVQCSSKTLLEEQSMKGIIKYIKNHNVKNVIVMAGAGISTAAGIPDFRTKGTGLYDNLQRFDLPYAEAIFDIEYFRDKPEPFYALAKELYPGKYYPTKTHYFLQLLHKKSILKRVYTQNIDTLERIAGLPADMVVEAHGSFASASCIQCKEVADPDRVRLHVRDARVVRCEACDSLVKPDITFFGQSLPDRFFEQLSDFDETDLLIVIGTSLQVQPFASLIDNVPDHVPRLLINKELAGVQHSRQLGFDFDGKRSPKRDVAALGDCDEQITVFADLMGWKMELEILFTKGHHTLRTQWEFDENAEIQEELLPIPKEKEKEKEDKEDIEETIKTLAEDLEHRLHLPTESEEPAKAKSEEKET